MIRNKMKVFFVDYENVSYKGLEGVQRLTPDDFVYIFHNNKETIPFSILNSLNLSQVEFIEVNVGTPNALDFQLVSYLGFKLRDEEIDAFFIVSKDNGFNNTVVFWKDRGFNISRVARIDDIWEDGVAFQSISEEIYAQNPKVVESVHIFQNISKDIRDKYKQCSFTVKDTDIDSHISFLHGQFEKYAYEGLPKGQMLSAYSCYLQKMYRNNKVAKRHYDVAKNCLEGLRNEGGHLN